MRGWLAAAKDVLPQRFDEVEFWSFACALDAPWVKWQKIRPVSSRWAIQSIFYNRAVHRMMSSKSADYLTETLIQCTGTHLEQTDIRFIHFWATAYSEAAAQRPESLKLPFKDKLLLPGERKSEKVAMESGNTGEWWCVSRGIAAPIARDADKDIILRFLPNSYDPERFNHHVRNQYHTEMRKYHGFGPYEIVLGFSAFGHFERKGLRQAAQVIDLLRAKGYPLRLLVLGGSSGAIKSFQKSLSNSGIDFSGLRFAGLVDQMEKHLSAADAFFMPSHFEAFSLAEIEAAALGLRLYLTAHPGHEMILKEHDNGRLLPWDPDGIAAILEEEIQTKAITRPHQILGEALTTIEYAAALGKHYDAAINRKWPKA